MGLGIREYPLDDANSQTFNEGNFYKKKKKKENKD